MLRKKVDPALIARSRPAMLGLLRAGRPDDATGVLGTWRGSLVRLFWDIRSIVLDAIAFARNLCRSRSALAAENLFLRKQLTFFVERKQAPLRTDNATRVTMATLARLFDWKEAPLSWSSPIRSFCGTGKGFGRSGVGSLGQRDVQRCQRS